MVSRRRVLTLSGSVLAMLAGCSGEAPPETETAADEAVRDVPGGPPAEATTDFEVRSLRAPREESFVSLGEPDDSPLGRKRDFVLDEEDATSL